MDEFSQEWEDIQQRAKMRGLEPDGEYVPEWMEFVQREGYKARLHGDILNKRIVDHVVRLWREWNS